MIEGTIRVIADFPGEVLSKEFCCFAIPMTSPACINGRIGRFDLLCRYKSLTEPRMQKP